MKILKYSLWLLIAVSLGPVSPLSSTTGPPKSREVRFDQSFHQNSGPILVGYYGDLSGRMSNFGRSTKNGVELAAAEINESGGINGRQIEILFEDDEGQPEKAAAVAAKLIDDGNVIAVIGEVSSANTLAAAPKAQHSQIPMIAPAATHPAVTQVGDYIFRVCFIDPFQGEVMAKFAANTLKARRAAILLDSNSPYNVGLTALFEATFTRLRGQIVSKQTYLQGDLNFRRQLRAIRIARPDVIYVPGYYDQVGLIAMQAKQLGLLPPLLGGDGWDSPQLWDIGGKALNGDFISNHYSPNDPFPAVQKFIVAYKTRHGSVPDALAALGYDAMGVLADAIKRAGTTEGPVLRKEISLTKNYPGVTGPISINDQRNAVKPAVVFKLQDGRFIYQQRIYPEGITPPAGVAAVPPPRKPALRKRLLGIAEIHMAKDDGNGDPGETTTVFSPSDRTMHCVTALKEARPGTKMKFSWWFLDADGTKSERIKEIDYTTKILEDVIHSHLTLPQDWPQGKYKVEVYVNGKLKKSAFYSVE